MMPDVCINEQEMATRVGGSNLGTHVVARLTDLGAYLNVSKESLLEAGIYLGIGFLVGFFLKKYSQYVVAMLVMLLCIHFLNHLEVVTFTINWSHVQQACNISGEAFDKGIVHILLAWAKEHAYAACGGAIGFLAGIWLG